MLAEPSEDEKRICQLQNGFAARLRRSQYYIIEPKKTNGEPPASPGAKRQLTPSRAGAILG